MPIRKIEVLIGEGSAAANGFNVIGRAQYRMKNPEIPGNMQKFMFDRLGYTELAESMGIRLIKLHCGDGVKSNPIVTGGRINALSSFAESESV